MPDMIRMTPPVTPKDPSGRASGTQQTPGQQQQRQVQNVVDPARVPKSDSQDIHPDRRPNQFTRGLESNFERFFSALRALPELSDSFTELVFTKMGSVATSNLSENFTEAVSEYFEFIKMNESEMLSFIKTLAGSSSKFSGPFFDVLRNVMAQSSSELTRTDALNFMRVFDSAVSGGHIINNIIITLEGMLDYVRPGQRAQLEQMIGRLRADPERNPQTAGTSGSAEQAGGAARQPQASSGTPAAMPQPVPAAKTADQSGGAAEGVREIPGGNAARADTANEIHTAAQSEIRSDGRSGIIKENNLRMENLNLLKTEVLPFLSKYIGISRDFGPIRDHVTMLTLNLARYESGTLNEFTEALERLLARPEMRERLGDASPQALLEHLLGRGSDSEYGKLFTSLIERGVRGEGGTAAKEIFENIMNACLINKSVYMPLMHIMLPAEVDGKLFFSEIWIDPDSGDDGAAESGGGRTVKLFIKFDIKDLGLFEIILLNRGEETDFRIFYPPQLSGRESDMRGAVGDIIAANGLRVRNLSLEKFSRPNTLNEVFPKIYEGRNSINVKV